LQAPEFRCRGRGPDRTVYRDLITEETTMTCQGSKRPLRRSPYGCADLAVVWHPDLRPSGG